MEERRLSKWPSRLLFFCYLLHLCLFCSWDIIACYCLKATTVISTFSILSMPFYRELVKWVSIQAPNQLRIQSLYRVVALIILKEKHPGILLPLVYLQASAYYSVYVSHVLGRSYNLSSTIYWPLKQRSHRWGVFFCHCGK